MTNTVECNQAECDNIATRLLKIIAEWSNGPREYTFPYCKRHINEFVTSFGEQDCYRVVGVTNVEAGYPEINQRADRAFLAGTAYGVDKEKARILDLIKELRRDKGDFGYHELEDRIENP